MRILHIVPTLNSGGAEKMLVDLVEGMVHKGVYVEVLVLSRQDDFYSKKMKDLGVIVHYAKVDKVYHLSHIRVIRNFLTQDFDIIHTHLFASQFYTAIAKKVTFNKSKLITTEHSTNNRRRKMKAFKFLDNLMYRQYEKVIAITEGVREELRNYMPSTQKKIVVINNGIKLEQYAKATPLECKNLVDSYKDNDVLILMVASMREQKDHETVIRASKLLPSNCHIIFVGDGVNRQKVQSYAKEYGSSKIHFLGKRSDVASVMKTADIFVLSSHREGFGLVAVEAMAAGLPVIATNVIGLKEVVGKAGILFESQNELQLAEAIKKIIDNKEFQTGLINKGVQKSREFSIEKTVKGYLRVYSQIQNLNFKYK